MNTTDGTKPTFIRAELAAYLPLLDLMEAITDSPEAMWKQTSKYLPKWEHEDPEVYNIRKRMEPCFGGTKRTLSAGVGMLWANDPTIVWNKSESVLKPLSDNVDAAGTKLSVFGARFSHLALRDGFALLLIDHPPQPKDAAGQPITIHAGNEADYGLRPKLAMYARKQILNWFTQTIQVENRTLLSRVVLLESSQTEDGPYGVKTMNRFRVLRLLPLTAGGYIAYWRLLEETTVGTTVTYEQIGAGVFQNKDEEIATELPVEIAYTGHVRAPFVADVPLSGVAYANLSHWQYATDLKFNRTICGFEQMVITGELTRDPLKPDMPGQLKFGPLLAIGVQLGGSAEWKGPSGKGLAELANGVREKLEEQDQLGLGFLIPRSTVQKTATETAINSFAQLSTLATAGKGIEDAINGAYEWLGWYYGVEKKDCPVLTINTDFNAKKMDAQTMAVFVTLKASGYPTRIILAAFKDGGWINEDEDLEDLEREWDSAASDLVRAQQGTLVPPPSGDGAHLDQTQNVDPSSAPPPAPAEMPVVA